MTNKSSMGTKDFALAISVYDKFTDVRVLVDIFRCNFQRNVFIVACSSHTEAERQLAGCDLDELVKIDRVPFDPKTYTDEEARLHLTMRVLDSIRQSCGRSAVSGAPYTLHVHADGYPLSWERLRYLMEVMLQKGKVFAARGDGWGLYTRRDPVGAFDDMFFVVDNAFARASGLWDFDLGDFLPHKVSIHGALAILAMTRVGLRRFWHYASHQDAVYWDGQPVVQFPLNSAQPMYFDSDYRFLHIYEPSFPDGLGYRLKAWYLRQHSLTRGPAIQAFLDRWDTDQASLFQQLRDCQQHLERFFTLRGLSCLARLNHGRDLCRMARDVALYRHRSPLGKVRWLLHAHAGMAKTRAKRLYLQRVVRGHVSLDMYPDMVWPGQLQDVYRRMLKGDARNLQEFTDLSWDTAPRGRGAAGGEG